ncbi:MAG: hypothetical protein JWM82_1499 [Myxococcales bacterium]|nr:hypothetical protein [Myxococcales bacterium]
MTVVVVIATSNVRLGPMDSGTSDEPTPPLTLRRFTADEAMRMVEIGIVGEDEPFELLGGEFVDSDPTTGDELIRRFTGDEAMRLVESGIIGENEHVELGAGDDAETREIARRLALAGGINHRRHDADHRNEVAGLEPALVVAKPAPRKMIPGDKVASTRSV